MFLSNRNNSMKDLDYDVLIIPLYCYKSHLTCLARLFIYKFLIDAVMI